MLHFYVVSFFCIVHLIQLPPFYCIHTDFVVVGKAPGASKVGQARNKDIPLMDLLSLRRLLLGQAQLEDVASQPPPRITSFSSGYMGNRIANY